MMRETAEAWERAWAVEAGRQGVSPDAWDYWTRGEAWILEQWGRRRAG
jgi:hypothetical protein